MKNGWRQSGNPRITEMFSYTNKCFYCGKTVVLYSLDATPSGGLPKDAATVDHVYSKSDYRRTYHSRRGEQTPIVLSCHSCNQDRADLSFEDYCKKWDVDLDKSIYFV